MMLMRTILNIPANSPKMLLNANVMGADVILFDLEDGVAPGQKPFARELLCAYLRRGLFQGQAMVRVNDVHTPYFLDDIAAVLPLSILGIMLPKMETPEEIRYADERMRAVELENGLGPGSRIVLGTAETALGVENALACLTASSRVAGCSFGSEDFAVSLGVKRSEDNDELDYARRHLVVAAKAAGKLAVDTVYTDVNDEMGLRKMTEQGRRLGYDGKFVISPRQVPVVHDVYTPTETEILHARQVRAAMAEAEREGRGVAVLNGKMLDKPVLRQAETTLALAAASGALERGAAADG